MAEMTLPQLETQTYYALLTPAKSQEKEQQALLAKAENVQTKYGINPLAASYTDLANFCYTDFTPTVKDYNVNSHTEGMIKADRLYHDLCSYLYSRFVTFPNVSKDWCLSQLAPAMSSLNAAIAAGWIDFSIHRSVMLQNAEIALCQLHMTIQHFQQCRFLTIDHFVIILAKINGLNSVVKNWRKFADQPRLMPSK